MANNQNNQNKYAGLDSLRAFLDNLKTKFSEIGHKHTISDLSDYTVDTALSPTSSNPVANSVLDAEFDAISDALGALELAIDGKADSSHAHTIANVTNLQSSLDSKVPTSRTINNKPLSENITLSASDVGAAASSHSHDDRYYTETEIDTKLASKSDMNHNHDSKYDAKGSSATVQENLDAVSDSLDAHTTNTNIHVTTANKTNWNAAYTHSTSAHARTDATKVEDSTTNGNILINGTETNVYSHPNSGVTAGTYKSVTVNAQGHVTGGSNPTTLSGYGITDAESKGAASAALTSAKEYTDTVASGKSDTTHNHDSVYDTKGSASSALASAKTYADSAATTAANKVKNDLLNGAGGAYDTLKELGDLIDDNKDAIDALETVASGKADAVHTHAISDVTNLQSVLDSKANLTHIHPYGVCSSSATYTTKTVTVDNFSLVEGARVIVKFTNANSASSPKLNVNSTGAIPIMRYGTTAAGSNTTTNGWEAGAVLAFTYDGTNWVQDYWYNTTYTNASLGQGYGTCYTSSSTAEKTVSMSNYEDKTGGIVSIKFTYSVDAGATLNINSQGGMDIYYKGSAIVDDVIKGGDIATFICSGSTYHLISVDRWFEDIAELQANDRRVRQMPTSTNGNFRLLLTPSFQSEDTTAYTYFDSGVYLNPHYNTLYGADIDGSATGVKGVTSGNFLVGNDDENMVEKTPAEVLSMINGASVATMTTAEYNALETRNTNTLYMLTDAEEDNIDGLDDMVQINLDGAVEGEASLVNAGTLNGKNEDMLSVLRAVEATNAENALHAENATNAENTNTLGGKVESELSVANSVNANNANTLEGHSVNSLLNKIYPIGSIYMSVNSTSPATLFGGTWEALKDRFLLGASSTYSAGSTGGTTEHRHTAQDMRAMIGAASGDASSINYVATSAYDPNTGAQTTGSYAINGSGSSGRGFSHYTPVVGYTTLDTNMPPYLAVFMWKRVS